MEAPYTLTAMINLSSDKLHSFFHSLERSIATACRTVTKVCFCSRKLADLEVNKYLAKTYEKSKADGYVKDVTEFYTLLFPPNRKELPADWEKIVAKIPKEEGLLELEKLEKQLDASQRFSLKEFLSKLNWIQVSPEYPEVIPPKLEEIPVSEEVIRKTLIESNPLFAKAWELAKNPDIKELTEDFARNSHLPGWAACYIPGKHTICLLKNALNGQKLCGLIFETMNAVQRKSFEILGTLNLSREEYAICAEYIEWHSYVWERKMLYPKGRLIDFYKAWELSNIPSPGQSVTHADTQRKQWDHLFSYKYAFQHPDAIQNRLEELSRVGKICKLKSSRFCPFLN
jgi:hypothetical protein